MRGHNDVDPSLDGAAPASRQRSELPAPVAPTPTALVVVARQRRPSRTRRDGDWRRAAHQEWLPVGIRHAVPATPRSEPTRALCGVEVPGWQVFWDLPFAPAPGSSCLRCLQVGVASRAPQVPGQGGELPRSPGRS